MWPVRRAEARERIEASGHGPASARHREIVPRAPGRWGRAPTVPARSKLLVLGHHNPPMEYLVKIRHRQLRQAHDLELIAKPHMTPQSSVL